MSSTKATETKRTLREQEAEQHAAQAKAKAGEATAAAGESAREATQAAKQKLSQAGEATKDATAQAAESTKQGAQQAANVASEYGQAASEKTADAAATAKDKLSHAGEATAATATHAADATKQSAQHAADVASEYGHIASEKASEAAAIAKEKLSEAGETVQSVTHSALETVEKFIKEHLPKVEHEEEVLSPEERRSKALLNEAMGREGEPEPEIEPLSRSNRELPSEVEVITLNKPKARSLVESAARTADDALGAPFEMRSRAEAAGVVHEDRSAKGLGEVVGEQVEHAREYVRGSGQSASERSRHYDHPPAMHEYTALPGDIHIPLVKKALREHVLHRPARTGTTVDTTTDTTRPTTTEEVLEDAKRRAAEATKTAEAEASAAGHKVGDTLSEAYHKVADPITGVVHSAEEKVKWGYEHTKDELLHKTSAETHEEMAPHTPYEAALATGAIPSSTDKVLHSSGTGTATGTTTMAPGTPQKVGGASVGGVDAEAADALAKSSEGYGSENLAAPDHPDLAKEVVISPATAGERSTTRTAYQDRMGQSEGAIVE